MYSITQEVDTCCVLKSWKVAMLEWLSWRSQSFFAEMLAGGLVNTVPDGRTSMATSRARSRHERGNFTHAAGADLLDDAVVAQLSADE